MKASKPDRSLEYQPGPENGWPGPILSRYSRPGPSLSGSVWGSNFSEEKFFYVFFPFQAILNTFYFRVKNLEKKYSKSQEDTPPPHNWKNILYLYFMFMPFWALLNFSEKINIKLVPTARSSFYRPGPILSYSSFLSINCDIPNFSLQPELLRWKD